VFKNGDACNDTSCSMIRILFLILVLYSCSKEKRAYNKLDGIWEVTQARIIDGQGFTFYDDSPTGTIEFKSNTKVCSATFAFSYENLSEVPLIIYDTLDYNSAAFILNNKGGELEVFQVGFGSLSDKFRIIVLTKDALVIEYYDYPNYKLKRFTLRKK
jgi:hypothetical protein